MGFRVKKLPYKKGPGWKLQLVSYKDDKQTSKDVPRPNWLTHGFSPNMSFEEATALASSLNRVSERQRQAERIETIKARTLADDDALNAHFPAGLLREFEEKRLAGRRIFNDTDRVAFEKRKSHWKAAKLLIAHVELEPHEWWLERNRFYDYFAAKSVSFSYVQKVLRLVNEWGDFCAHKKQLYFKPVPLPSKRERERINDRYFDKNGQGKESDPLTLSALNTAKGRMKPEHWNWLFCTAALGLRPHEADKLKDPKYTSILFDDELKCDVLKVYQPKLVNIKREDRFKYIVCKYPEQKEAISLVKTQQIKRPLEKTVNYHFGDKVNLYGGRKAFESLMLSRGEPFENISAWLGHQTVDRTWRSYRDKRKARYRKAA